MMMMITMLVISEGQNVIARVYVMSPKEGALSCTITNGSILQVH